MTELSAPTTPRTPRTPRPAIARPTTPKTPTTTPRRRGRLTLDNITLSEREHLEMSIHESAHAVAGVLLGGRLHNAVVTDSRIWGVEGLTTFADRPPGRDPEVAYAGPWGQARWSAGRRPTRREVLAVLNSTGHKDDRVLLAAGGIHRGAAIAPALEQSWPAVVSVAKLLHRDGEVRQADVLAALGITDGGGPGSAQLAWLRSR